MAEPFVKILYGSGRPELWLCTLGEQGCIKPLGETGPVQLPSAWTAELERARTPGVKEAPVYPTTYGPNCIPQTPTASPVGVALPDGSQK